MMLEWFQTLETALSSWDPASHDENVVLADHRTTPAVLNRS